MSEFMKFDPNPIPFFKRVEDLTPELLASYKESAYDWQPGDEGCLRITKSSLNTHNFCPYQYKLSNIYRLPTIENEAMVKGSNVHAIVEYFWANVDEPPHEPECICNNLNHNRYDETCPQNQENRFELTSVLKAAKTLLGEGNERKAREMLHAVMPEPPEPYEYGEKVVIEKWFDWQWERFLMTKGIDWAAVGNEVSVHARINVEIHGEDIPVHIRGFIDTIFSDGEGGFILMELKTGKWNLRKAKSMREEMQFYRLALEEGQQSEYLPVSHWAWEFPNGTANGGIKSEWEIEKLGTRKTSYAPRTVNNNIRKLVLGHVTGIFEPEPHAAKCEWCDYMELCPAWGGTMGEEE